MQHGQEEDPSLAGPNLYWLRYVGSIEYNGNGLLLDWNRYSTTDRLDGGDDTPIEEKLFEIHGDYSIFMSQVAISARYCPINCIAIT